MTLSFSSFVRIACLALLLSIHTSANALISEESSYNGKIVVPPFVPDVRSLLIQSATRHGWKVIDEKAGELTFELRHVKANALVVAKAAYSKTEIRLDKKSEGKLDATVAASAEARTYQRWMIGLRREIGLNLLLLAIKDAGGTVRERTPVAVEAD